MDPGLTSTQLTELFHFYTEGVLTMFCPEKQVFSRPDDKPFVTEEMKIFKSNIMLEYEKRGKSQKLNTFDLHTHVEENLTASQSAELIADHFAAISMDYDPININNFPPSLSHPDGSIISQLEEYQMYK